MKGIKSTKFFRSVSRYPFSSRMSLKQSILLNGTPAFKNDRTTFTRKTCSFSGKVSPTKWNISLCFCNALAISFSCFSLECSLTFLSLCFELLIWLLTLLLFKLSSSLQALQKSFPADKTKGSLLYSLICCWAVTFFGSEEEFPRVFLRFPTGGLLATSIHAS